jgi:ribonuclease HI
MLLHAPDAFKRAVSEQSVEARRLRFGIRPLFTISTDASVRSTGSAGTARFFDKDLHLLDDDPLVDRRTGSLACSYTAESVTILRALQRLRRILPDKATRHDWILLITDSQSFLSELATGPVRHKTASHYGETWKTLLELGARGYRLVLQFVHSHVGVELNEIADEYVTYLNDTLPDHDSTLVHRVDSMRYFRNTLPTRLSGLGDDAAPPPRGVPWAGCLVCNPAKSAVSPPSVSCSAPFFVGLLPPRGRRVLVGMPFGESPTQRFHVAAPFSHVLCVPLVVPPCASMRA